MLILSGVLIFIGIAMIIGGRVFRYYKMSQEIYQGSAVGKVVDLVMDKPDKEGEQKGVHHYYYPVIAYYANGLLYKSRYKKGSNPSEFTMNQELKLCYDINKPYHFEIAEFNPKIVLGTLIYAAGMLFSIAGIISFLVFASR